ncbi:FERM domain-containing protein 4A-like isoform 1-T1 [Molossus nigricans]
MDPEEYYHNPDPESIYSFIGPLFDAFCLTGQFAITTLWKGRRERSIDFFLQDPAQCWGGTCNPGPESECLKQEFAIQSQIMEAACYLTSDPCVSKKLKKQWKPSHLNSLTKLQELENAVNKNCIKSGKKPTQRTSLIIDDENIGSEDSSLSDALVLEDGGGKSKIKVLVSITISMPIHAVPKGTAAKSTAPGHDEHQILHTGRGLLIQAYSCRSSKD